ncbi:unnamed protein product [Rotaria sp. Silwood1]|nr:unnamed protein product [Rotaria sp. Silwood1]
MIDDVNKKFIEQSNKHIELIFEHIKSLQYTSNSTKNHLNKIRIDLNQRYEIRNNYYHRKFPLLLHDLSLIKSNKINFQLIEKQHNRSIKFYKNVFNIQSSINMEQYDKQLQQSIKTLNNLKNNINQYENNINQLKQKLFEQNQQINFYVNNLLHIQYEQYLRQLDIQQLKQKILFEKNLYYEIKQIYSEEKNSFFNSKITFEILSKKIFQGKQYEYIHQLKQKQQILKNEEITLKNILKNSKDLNQNQLHRFHIEYITLTDDIAQTKLNIKQNMVDLLPLQSELSAYRTIFNTNRITFTQSQNQPLLVPTTTMNTEEIIHESASLINNLNEPILPSEQQQQQLPIESNMESESTTFKSEKIMPATAKLHRSESLGPNLQSRLEALEAAMGVRLNVAKRQGRHSLSNTTSSSPMQLSPTSSTTATINTSISNSLSTSTRHNIPTRTGQGVQRSASSCDAENRPGPIKRLKPSLPNENSSSSPSTVAAIATVKKYPPLVRRPLPTSNITPTRPTQSKQSTPIKQRSSPMDTSSPRLSRSSTASNNSSSNSSNYRTPIGSISPKTSHTPSPKTSHTPSPKSQIINSLPNLSTTISNKKSLSIFGEQFSDDIIKINLFWIDSKELDDESRSEVILQFGSLENFLREQNLFFKKQQQQLKIASKNKTNVIRSRFHLSIMKKDRLELL